MWTRGPSSGWIRRTGATAWRPSTPAGASTESATSEAGRSLARTDIVLLSSGGAGLAQAIGRRWPRDSNPRASYPATRSPGVPLRPLGQATGGSVRGRPEASPGPRPGRGGCPVAEATGFEPVRGGQAPNRFRGGPVRPLRHASGASLAAGSDRFGAAPLPEERAQQP